MYKFKFYFILTITSLALFSCSKNDDSIDNTPPREYSVQYATDLTDIEEYLKTYYITVTDHAGFTDDQDVTFTKIPTGGSQPTIYSYLNSATYPKLLSKEVSLHDITYKLYYLVLRPGTGQSPCNVDGVLAAYKGDYLARKTVETVTSLSATSFETVKFPQQFLSLFTTITGWGEGFPLFKTGTTSSNTDGTVSFNDFGAGVLFIPSGLAYYNNGAGSIPSYAPLVFSFKLYQLQRLDQDQDGIPSYQEDLNGDGFLRVLATGVDNVDDTDKDGIPNFIDIDDDADNFTTKLELKKPDGTYHTFETVPSCSGQTIKRYLTASCKPPYLD